ncbi:hypothetical protein L195_g005402 [Trifolium pratense]|uniref:Uncharacterized protein n=1 Tax=Trifolium pratense TaxID=57577 RepID=A0A2K3P0P5_TRIPR|nr:hypothetical protein L195_g005402 [Trifolium pratense]
MEYTGNEMKFHDSLLTLLMEKMVDFEVLKVNNFDVESYFLKQGWKRYFDMLNGPVYPDLLKHFWMKARVFTKSEAELEEKMVVANNPSLLGKTRGETRLMEFTETQIRLNICGLNLILTKRHFIKLLDLEDSGKNLDMFEKDDRYREALLHKMFHDLSAKGKVKGITEECRVFFKIIISSITPRTGGTDTISWTHRHLIYFLLTNKKFNLGDYLFERICEAIHLSKTQKRTFIVHPRLLSELFYQCKLVKQLKKFDSTLVNEEVRPEVLTAGFLTKMHIIKTKLVQPKKSHNVTRDMVPPALTADPHGARRKGTKRKDETKEKDVKEDLLKQKKVKIEKEVEVRTKQKHEIPAKKIVPVSPAPKKRKMKLAEPTEDSSETNTDDQTIAERIRRGKITPVVKGASFIAQNTSANKLQKLDEQTPYNTPLKELMKHLSTNTLNSHAFTHEIASTNPQPNFSPEKQPLTTPQESPNKPSSESKPDDEDQTLPDQSSDLPDNMDTDLPNQSFEQPESPVLIHTCAPPPPLTMADLVMSASVFDEAFEHIFENPEVDVDNYVYLVSRKDLNSIKFKRKTTKPEKPYLKPYTFTKTSDPNSDPFDILSIKLGDVLDVIAQEVKDDIANKGMEAARIMMQAVEMAGLKRLTHISNEEIEAAKSEAARQVEEARKAEEESLVQLARDRLAQIARELEAKRLNEERELAEAKRLEEECDTQIFLTCFMCALIVVLLCVDR